MSHGKKVHGRGQQLSRQQRDLQRLQAYDRTVRGARPAGGAATLLPAPPSTDALSPGASETAPPVHEPPPAPEQPVAGAPGCYTFNWAAGADALRLRPRLLTDAERPDLTHPALRTLVNLTARGEPTPPALHAVVLTCASEDVVQAILEGIRRWHTFAPLQQEQSPTAELYGPSRMTDGNTDPSLGETGKTKASAGQQQSNPAATRKHVSFHSQR